MTVLFDVFVLGRSVTRVIDDALADTGLNGFDYAMTSMLAGHGPMTPSEIGTVTGMPPTTVSGVLRRLDTRELIDRRPHPQDGRASLIVLTDRGEGLTEAARERFQQAVDLIEARLGDVEAVRHSLQQLDDAVRVVADIPQRPFRVSARPLPQQRPLTEAQQEEVRAFVAWITARDQTSAQTDQS